MSADNYIRYTCEGCNTLFDSVRPKRYCTKLCNKKHIKRKKQSVSREEYRAKVRENSKSKFICEHCGIEAHRKLSGANKKRNTGNRFCSMDCRVAFGAAARASAELRTTRLKAEMAALHRIARYVERPSIFWFNCTHCATPMIVRRTVGLHKQCCDACRAESVRSIRRTAKAFRRAKERGTQADSIDPIKVFERDKWKCHICGIKTPRKLRGTYDDRAPELEHIVPLSQGGTHTWGNVACSCRKCNGAKGATALGQLGLAIAA